MKLEFPGEGSTEMVANKPFVQLCYESVMRRMLRDDRRQFMSALQRARVAGFAALALLIANPVFAQDRFPSKPVRLVLGFSAGGGQDAMFRRFAESFSTALGVPVITDNKVGANGNIAAESVAKASADGYTVLWNTSSLVLSPWVYSKLNYDYTTDLVPLGMAVNTPLVLAVPASTPANNVKEFVEYIKADPRKISYGSAGLGNVTHLTAVRFLDSIGVEATHVPYKGESQVLPDLMVGRVQFYFGTVNGLLSHFKGGKLKVLATAGARRFEGMPEIPTLEESVALVPGVEGGSWGGLMVPAKTPPNVIERLSAAMMAALKDPALISHFIATGVEVRSWSAAEYGEYLKLEKDRWGAAVKRAGIKSE